MRDLSYRARYPAVLVALLTTACGGRLTGTEGSNGTDSPPAGVSVPVPIDRCAESCAARASCLDAGSRCMERCRELSTRSAGQCGAAWNAWQACVLEKACDPVNGNTCNGLYEILEACLKSSSGGRQPAADSGSDVPPAIRPSVPQCDKVDVVAVCGPISISSVGPGACEMSCRGNDGSQWGSFCRDALCVCTNDGYTYCGCSLGSDRDPCRTCCPGLKDI